MLNDCKKLCIELIQKIEYIIENSNSLKEQYESIVINVPREKINNFFLHLIDKIKIKKIEGEFLKEGSKIIWGTDGINEIISTIIKNEKDPNKKKWKFWTIQQSKNIVCQEIKIEIIKIDENKTFLSILNIFKENIKNKCIQIIKEKKQKLLMFLKEKFECLDENEFDEFENQFNGICK